jgi:hypothetical protein
MNDKFVTSAVIYVVDDLMISVQRTSTYQKVTGSGEFIIISHSVLLWYETRYT